MKGNFYFNNKYSYKGSNKEKQKGFYRQQRKNIGTMTKTNVKKGITG